MLFTARSPEFNTPEGKKAAETCRQMGIWALWSSAGTAPSAVRAT